MTTDHTPALAAEVPAPSTLEPQALAVLAEDSQAVTLDRQMWINRLMALVDEHWSDSSAAKHRSREAILAHVESAGRHWAAFAFLRAAPPPVAPALADLNRDALIDIIRQGLSLTWHCHRVWGAWSVGTMSEDDFSPVDESDTPEELADAILARFAVAAPAAVPARNEPHEPQGARAGSSGSALGRSDARPSGSILGEEPVAHSDDAQFLRDALEAWEGSHCGGDCIAAPCGTCDGTMRTVGKGQRLQEALDDARAQLADLAAATQPLRQPLTEAEAEDAQDLDADGEPFTGERLADWLDKKWLRHHELEDRAAANWIRARITTRSPKP